MEIMLIIYMIFSLALLKGSQVFKKQLIWYIIGFIFYFLFKKIKKENIFNISIFLYILCNILLLYLLIFGSVVNGAKAWINLGFISFQPSEFMKIILIIFLSILKDKKSITLFLIALIPSILTFLEPDTGNVIFYFIILFTILFIKSPKLFIKPFILIIVSISLFITLYFFKQDLFIKIFGTSFFYRFDRVVSLFSNPSYQLSEALKEMGASGFIGNDINVIIPASLTDFAFASLTVKYGFLITLLFLLFNLIVNLYLIKLINKKNGIIKTILICLFILKITQEMIHILMNVGLFPIIGITLPFLSYGGSSIISYMMIFGLVNNCSNMDNLGQDYNKLV